MDTDTTQKLTRLFAAVILMNGVDAVMTMAWVESGIATEANPLMAVALDTHPALFVLIKLTLVGLALTLLWRLRHIRAVTTVMVAMAVTYGLVMLIHAGGVGLTLALMVA